MLASKEYHCRHGNISAVGLTCSLDQLIEIIIT